jgi:DNA topoisomerase-3
MKTFILTEKPSVAKDFAKALNAAQKGPGCYQNENYFITWAVGHLVELFEPHDYESRWRRWQLGPLPIIPETFRYKPIKKRQKQLNIIYRLLKEPSIDRLVIATDAGREGEVIARSIFLTAGMDVNSFNNDSRMLRFWTSQALTPEVIRQGMKALKPASEYDRLWRAGRTRQIADWLVGMNASRAASIQMKDLFSVGRVQTAVLALLVDRLRKRQVFKPEPYWLLKARFCNQKGEWWGTWFKNDDIQIKNLEPAKELLSHIQGATGEVLSVFRQEKRRPPPYLYALTDLQRDANKRFEFSAQKTLTIAQALYESKKCLSYPRTDARVLGTQSVDLVKQVIESLNKRYPKTFSQILPERIDSRYRRVFNDAKLSDHHAVIPLAPLPVKTSADEEKIYMLVLKRFAAAFHPDCRYEQTTIITGVNQEIFRTLGNRILSTGWQILYLEDTNKTISGDKKTEKTESLPFVEKGDDASVQEAVLQEKKTLPPPEYTEALLLKDMINPSRYVTSEDMKSLYRGDVGLGTQATRAQIIETLLNRHYVERKKRYLLATEKGCLLIDSLRQFNHCRLLTSPEETARWEMRLKRIAQGKEGGEAFIEDIKAIVAKSVEELKKGFVGKTTSTHRETASTLGKCPVCQGFVIEGKKGFGCSNWRKKDGACSFVIWKTIAGRPISKNAVGQLLNTGVTDFMVGFLSKKGKHFSARLKLQKHPADEVPRVTFSFDK